MKLLIATRNPGKLREYEALLDGLGLELVGLNEGGIALDVQETGTTFRENAVLKAQTYAQAAGLLTLADDSGLEVDALGGEPGVRSARYDGWGGSDQDRYRLLLRRLEGVPDKLRTARFRCVVAIATPGGEVYTVEGTCEGRIAFRPEGSHGFGYDPVFLVPMCGCTMAQLPLEVKSRISHRARAVERAREILHHLRGEQTTTERRPRMPDS